MRLLLKVLTIALTSVIVPLCNVTAKNSYSQTIRQLDRALDKREKFISERRALIDSLKSDYSRHTGEDSKQLIKIGNAYCSFANDSAIHYFHQAINDAADDSERREATLRRAELLPLAGLYEAAEKTYSEVDTSAMDSNELQIYYNTGRQLYSYLAAAFEDFPQYSEKYKASALNHQKNLLALLDPQSEDYLFNLGEYYFMLSENARLQALL